MVSKGVEEKWEKLALKAQTPEDYPKDTIRQDGEIPKAALLWNPQGNRKRGRPKNSWRRSVVKEAGRSCNELRLLAADRQKWKELVDNLRS